MNFAIDFLNYSDSFPPWYQLNFVNHVQHQVQIAITIDLINYDVHYTYIYRVVHHF